MSKGSNDPPDEIRHEDDDPNRRQFLSRVAMGACAAAAVGSGAVTLDFLEPKVLFEPPTRFKAGSPLDYPEGTVKFNKERRAYVVGGSSCVYALSAVCTHLGCITRFVPDENAITCPCHGSRFDTEGNVTHGPAPRPLPWIEIGTDEKGELVVDTAIVIPHGKVFRV